MARGPRCKPHNFCFQTKVMHARRTVKYKQKERNKRKRGTKREEQLGQKRKKKREKN